MHTYLLDASRLLLSSSLISTIIIISAITAQASQRPGSYLDIYVPTSKYLGTHRRLRTSGQNVGQYCPGVLVHVKSIRTVPKVGRYLGSV